MPKDQVDEVRRERERISAELVDRIEQILRRAEDIDNDLKSVLGKAERGEISAGDADSLVEASFAGAGQGKLSTLGPPRDGTPSDNAGWWDSLSDGEKSQIIAEHPNWIGNLDGVPATARDAANRARLEDERTRLQQVARQLRAELDSNTFGGLFSNADAGLAQTEAKLKSLNAIDDVLARGNRQLLMLDMSGEGGTAATVTWIGYQAPQWSEVGGDNSVLDDEAAQRGAEKLRPFLNGIDASRNTDPHLTSLGHSYGSLTSGIALQGNTGPPGRCYRWRLVRHRSDTYGGHGPCFGEGDHVTRRSSFDRIDRAQRIHEPEHHQPVQHERDCRWYADTPSGRAWLRCGRRGLVANSRDVLMARITRAIPALAIMLILALSACAGDDSERDAVNEQFAELMKRPDVDQMSMRYEKLRAEIEERLHSQLGISNWYVDEATGGGSGCGIPFQNVDEGK